MNKEILRLAIPNIISNVSVPLLATVDTVLMGRLSADHLGAVGLGSMIFSFIYWNFGFLRMGTTGMISQAFGANDQQRIIDTLARASLLAVCIGCCILLIQGPLYSVSLQAMNVLPSQTSIVADYFSARIWAAPATVLLYVLMGYFFGMQNAIYPLILTISINVVNILCSYYCVEYLGLEATGVAIGTVIAQYFGVILAITLLIHRYRYVLARFSATALGDLQAIRAFFDVNADLFLRTICLTIAFGFFYSQSSAAGAMVLATNVILLQYVNWMSYGIDGFAYASESLVGKYHGMKSELQVSQAVQLSLQWGLALAVLYSLTYGVGGKYLLQLFTDDATVIEYAKEYVWWLTVLPILGYASYIWDGIYVGLTASRSMRNTMIIALASYMLCYYTLPTMHAIDRLWISLSTLLVIRGLMQWILYRKHGTLLT